MHRKIEMKLGLNLRIGKQVFPTRRIEWKGPHRGAQRFELGTQVAISGGGFPGDLGVRALASQVEPADGLAVIMQQIVRPAEFEHNRRIGRVIFLRQFQILQRIADEPGVQAAFGHHFGVDRRRRGLARARVQRLRQIAERPAHGWPDLHRRLSSPVPEAAWPPSSRRAPAAENRVAPRKDSRSRKSGELAEFCLGFGLPVHAEQQIGQFAAQDPDFRGRVARRAETRRHRDSAAAEVRGPLGGPRLASARGGQQRGIGFSGRFSDCSTRPRSTSTARRSGIRRQAFS